jgi:hypothetical protein
VKQIASLSKQFANSDVDNATVAQFPPMETPQTKPIPANTKTK